MSSFLVFFTVKHFCGISQYANNSIAVWKKPFIAMYSCRIPSEKVTNKFFKHNQIFKSVLMKCKVQQALLCLSYGWLHWTNTRINWKYWLVNLFKLITTRQYWMCSISVVWKEWKTDCSLCTFQIKWNQMLVKIQVWKYVFWNETEHYTRKFSEYNNLTQSSKTDQSELSNYRAMK